MTRDLSPIRRAQFLAAIPAAQRVTLIDRHEADYALTRLVHLNCGAVDEFAEETTTFVLKGGFAIRRPGVVSLSSRAQDRGEGPSEAREFTGLRSGRNDGLGGPEQMDASTVRHDRVQLQLRPGRLRESPNR